MCIFYFIGKLEYRIFFFMLFVIYFEIFILFVTVLNGYLYRLEFLWISMCFLSLFLRLNVVL